MATMTEGVREVLLRTSCTDNSASLPQDLERKLYQQVNDALERAGGEWDRNAKAHVFAGEAKAAIALLLSGDKLPEKNPLDFFATPPDVADMLVKALQIDWTKRNRILEPSAGEGALVEALVRNNRSGRKWDLTVVEIDLARHALLHRVCIQNQIASVSSSAQDFLDVWFGAVSPFDYVVMNPPFTAEGDPLAYMAHIETALKLLNPGGRLAAIVPSGCVHGASRRHQGFRALLIGLGAEFRTLPEKAFQKSGTGVSCVMIVLEMSADGSRLVAESATRKERESMPTMETPAIVPWQQELADLLSMPRIPLCAEDPLRAGDVIITNYKSGPYRVESISGCDGCRVNDYVSYPWQHVHLMCSGVDRTTLEPLKGSPFYLNGYRYVGDRMLGLQYAPCTSIYVAMDGGKDGDGYDEIFRIKRTSTAHDATKRKGELMTTTEIAPEYSARNVEQEAMLLPLDMIKPSKLNPRREFDDAQMQKLRDAIRFEGILSALTVRPLPDNTYEIVAGERRYRAATDLGFDVVPVVVRHVSDRQLVEMALSENMNREDLTPIDEAYAFSSLVSLGASQAEIAERIRKDVSYVSNTLRLLKLPKIFQDLITAGELTRAHGIAFCGLVVAGLEVELGQLVAKTQTESLTSRQVEHEVAEIKRRHEEALQPRLDTDPTTALSMPPAPGAAAQAELTPEGDVVFPVNTTSPSGVEPVASIPTSAPPSIPVTDRRHSSADASASIATSAPPARPSVGGPDTSVTALPGGAVMVVPGASTAPSSPTAPDAASAPSSDPALSSTAPTGPVEMHPVPSALADWLFEQDLTAQTAIESLRRLYDVAGRLGMTGSAYLTKLEDEN